MQSEKALPGGERAESGCEERPLASVPSDHLLDEVFRRGLLRKLHDVVGALYDHLDRTGQLDSASALTPYHAYRLRREDAALSGYPDAQDSVLFWERKLAQLEEVTAKGVGARTT